MLFRIPRWAIAPVVTHLVNRRSQIVRQMSAAFPKQSYIKNVEEAYALIGRASSRPVEPRQLEELASQARELNKSALESQDPRAKRDAIDILCRKIFNLSGGTLETFGDRVGVKQYHVQVFAVNASLRDLEETALSPEAFTRIMTDLVLVYAAEESSDQASAGESRQFAQDFLRHGNMWALVGATLNGILGSFFFNMTEYATWNPSPFNTDAYENSIEGFLRKMGWRR